MFKSQTQYFVEIYDGIGTIRNAIKMVVIAVDFLFRIFFDCYI